MGCAQSSPTTDDDNVSSAGRQSNKASTSKSSGSSSSNTAQSTANGPSKEKREAPVAVKNIAVANINDPPLELTNDTKQLSGDQEYKLPAKSGSTSNQQSDFEIAGDKNSTLIAQSGIASRSSDSNGKSDAYEKKNSSVETQSPSTGAAVPLADDDGRLLSLGDVDSEVANSRRPLHSNAVLGSDAVRAAGEIGAEEEREDATEGEGEKFGREDDKWDITANEEKPTQLLLRVVGADEAPRSEPISATSSQDSPSSTFPENAIPLCLGRSKDDSHSSTGRGVRMVNKVTLLLSGSVSSAGRKDKDKEKDKDKDSPSSSPGSSSSLGRAISLRETLTFGLVKKHIALDQVVSSGGALNSPSRFRAPMLGSGFFSEGGSKERSEMSENLSNGGAEGEKAKEEGVEQKKKKKSKKGAAEEKKRKKLLALVGLGGNEREKSLLGAAMDGMSPGTNSPSSVESEPSPTASDLNTARMMRSKGMIQVMGFEVANVIVRCLTLRQSLLPQDVSDLRSEVVGSAGVSRLVSEREDDTWKIAANDKRNELRVIARDVVRLGSQCLSEKYKNIAQEFNSLGLTSSPFYSGLSPGSDPVEMSEKSDVYVPRKFTEEIEKAFETEFKSLEALAQVTSDLYHELSSLESMQQALERKIKEESLREEREKREKGKEENNKKGDMLLADGKEMILQMSAEVRAQEKMVLQMKKKGAWDKPMEEMVEKLRSCVIYLFEKIVDVFGKENVILGGLLENDSSLALSRSLSSPRGETLGESGLALLYANIVNLIDIMLLCRDNVIDEESREKLYGLLPLHLKRRWKKCLRESTHLNNESSESIRSRLEGIMDWLVTMAENTIRHGVDLRLQGHTELTLLQTFHHCQLQRADECLLEILIGLQHLCARNEREWKRGIYFEEKPGGLLLSSKMKGGLGGEVEERREKEKGLLSAFPLWPVKAPLINPKVGIRGETAGEEEGARGEDMREGLAEEGGEEKWRESEEGDGEVRSKRGGAGPALSRFHPSNQSAAPSQQQKEGQAPYSSSRQASSSSPGVSTPSPSSSFTSSTSSFSPPPSLLLSSSPLQCHVHKGNVRALLAVEGVVERFVLQSLETDLIGGVYLSPDSPASNADVSISFGSSEADTESSVSYRIPDSADVSLSSFDSSASSTAGVNREGTAVHAVVSNDGSIISPSASLQKQQRGLSSPSAALSPLFLPPAPPLSPSAALRAPPFSPSPSSSSSFSHGAEANGRFLLSPVSPVVHSPAVLTVSPRRLSPSPVPPSPPTIPSPPLSPSPLSPSPMSPSPLSPSPLSPAPPLSPYFPFASSSSSLISSLLSPAHLLPPSGSPLPSSLSPSEMQSFSLSPSFSLLQPHRASTGANRTKIVPSITADKDAGPSELSKPSTTRSPLVKLQAFQGRKKSRSNSLENILLPQEVLDEAKRKEWLKDTKNVEDDALRLTGSLDSTYEKENVNPVHSSLSQLSKFSQFAIKKGHLANTKGVQNRKSVSSVSLPHAFLFASFFAQEEEGGEEGVGEREETHLDSGESERGWEKWRGLETGNVALLTLMRRARGEKGSAGGEKGGEGGKGKSSLLPGDLLDSAMEDLRKGKEKNFTFTFVPRSVEESHGVSVIRSLSRRQILRELRKKLREEEGLEDEEEEEDEAEEGRAVLEREKSDKLSSLNFPGHFLRRDTSESGRGGAGIGARLGGSAGGLHLQSPRVGGGASAGARSKMLSSASFVFGSRVRPMTPMVIDVDRLDEMNFDAPADVGTPMDSVRSSAGLRRTASIF